MPCRNDHKRNFGMEGLVVEGLIAASIFGSFSMESVFGIVTGGGALGFLIWLFKQARAPVEDYQRLSAERKEDNATLKEEVVHLKAQVQMLTEKIEKLTTELRTTELDLRAEQIARKALESRYQAQIDVDSK